jgi:hypothetical protein
VQKPDSLRVVGQSLVYSLRKLALRTLGFILKSRFDQAVEGLWPCNCRVKLYTPINQGSPSSSHLVVLGKVTYCP